MSSKMTIHFIRHHGLVLADILLVRQHLGHISCSVGGEPVGIPREFKSSVVSWWPVCTEENITCFVLICNFSKTIFALSKLVSSVT